MEVKTFFEKSLGELRKQSKATQKMVDKYYAGKT